MADNRCSCSQGTASNGTRETVCIDTMRVLDSCRDRDCYEDVRVYLTPSGQDLIDRTATVRTIDAKIVGTSIAVDEVPFNRGFYRINVRFYIRLKNEACVCAGTSRDFYALAVAEKSVVLYGGEASTSVFRSDAYSGFCTTACTANNAGCTPTAVVETVAPIVLSGRVVCCDGGVSSACSGSCSCGCSCSCDCRNHACGCEIGETIPAEICAAFPEGLIQMPLDNANRYVVSIGIFSVIRLERPAQYLISAAEYAVPDKECHAAENDDAPCCLFRSMAFPANAFGTGNLSTKYRKG